MATKEQLIKRAKSIKSELLSLDKLLLIISNKINLNTFKPLSKLYNYPEYKNLADKKNKLLHELDEIQKTLNGDYEFNISDVIEFGLDALSFIDFAEPFVNTAKGVVDVNKAVYDVYNNKANTSELAKLVALYGIENTIDILPGKYDLIASSIYYPIKWGKHFYEAITGEPWHNAAKWYLDTRDPNIQESDNTRVVLLPNKTLNTKKSKLIHKNSKNNK